MRRILGIGTLVLLIGMMLVAGTRTIAAQEATPTAAAGGGVTKQELGRGQSAVAPGRDLILQERTFAPGGDSGAHPAPGPVVLSVASGEIDFYVVQGAALLTRAGATTQETLAAGSDTELKPGDSVFYDQGVVHQLINEGSEPAVTIEARLNPSEATAATPTP
ncbi:MAG TPA: cupin domain-containing protein [Thermomicrobiales bacterium]|jgi:quercetin dioxygenase-like cupin family protein